jgi:hypothetical protein
MKSKGQVLVERIEALIRRYVRFDDEVADQPLALALFVLVTWVSEVFTVQPYVCVSAPTMRSGKTTCLDLLKLLVRNGQILATVRMLGVVTMIGEYSGKVVPMFDEAEQLGKDSLGDTRALLASGYRRGGSHGIKVGKRFEMFATGCCKVFGLIGDLTAVLRDRSIVLNLLRAKPMASLVEDAMYAETEAAAIRAEIALGLPVPSLEVAEWLKDRDREIWTPLYSLAVALRCDAKMLARIRRVSQDLTLLKGQPRREYHAAAAEREAEDRDYAADLLRDLAGVLRTGERAIFSAVAVERLKAVDTAPWRLYRGVGLDVDVLAGLVHRFGLVPKVKFIGGRKANGGQAARGYDAAAIRAAFVKLGV